MVPLTMAPHTMAPHTKGSESSHHPQQGGAVMTRTRSSTRHLERTSARHLERASGRYLTRAGVAVAAAVLLLAPTLQSLATQAVSAPAAAATLYGHDVSWPQCPAAQGGYDLPMPPETTQFVVIGLTNGLPFTTNPCLSSELAWATTRDKPTSAYTMAGAPTPAQLTTYGAAGPWSPTTRSGRLSNVGYAEATYAIAALSQAGWRPTMVWIDVEPRTAQPWPGATSKDLAENRMIVQGLMRGLDAAGFRYGIYTNTSGWAAIVGSWRLPGVPSWATAGKRTAADALAKCNAPGVSGGPVFQAQWWDDTRDFDLTCTAWTATPPRAFPPSAGSDLNGDWKNDLLTRRAATGELWLYPGKGTGAWSPVAVIGTGWARFDLIDTAGDLDGNGVVDVVARQAGTLWLYPRATNGWLPRVSLGSTWGGYARVFGPGDLTDDGAADLVAQQTTTGQLWLFPRTASGGFGTRVLIGTGWGSVSPVIGAGDWDGNGVPDLLARSSGGALSLYPRNANGTWGTRVPLGTGWSGMNAFAGIGDVNGDAVPDLVVREASTGRLFLYPRSETGWLPRVQVGSGWSGFDVIT